MIAQPARVLLYSATPRSDRGGVQRMMDDLEVELSTRGQRVWRVGPDEDAEAGGLVFAARTDAGADGRPALSALPAVPRALWRLARILRQVRPEVVNVHFITGEVVYFLALRRFFRFRLALSAHGGDLLRPSPQIRAHLPRILRAADAITAVSGELVRAVRETGGGDVVARLIPNGVDAGFWCPGEDRVVPGRIVAVGRLLPIKGFDVLIDAMRDLPEAHLRIMGQGEERDALEARIAAAGLGARVTLMGHLTSDAMRAELRRAEVFAMPSRGEGMPLALLEALGCGCPAVATPVGAIPDLLGGDAGLIVPVDDASALADGLRQALSGAAGLTRAGARDLALRYSRDACYGAYAAMIAGLAEARA